MTSRPPEGEPPGGNLRPTSYGVLVGWALVGLVGGWLLHLWSDRSTTSAPVVSWAQPLALVLVAAILGATAWLTHRALHVAHQRPESHRLVNRLVLAKACALVGALMAGGYAGYAVSWLGVDAELASQRAWRSAASALAGVAITITAILLERACRVGPDDDGS